ncbi:MAG: hypothetical protein OHK0032_04860 [Thermodesulfovibrionales bacterium]
MKPSVPEIGKVVRLDGETAAIILQGGESCRGCGAGRLGLCKPSGNISMLTAKNTIGASVGDEVKVGLNKDVHKRGYLLAFIIPLSSLVVGTLAGYIMGRYLYIPSLEVFTGFTAFLLTSLYSFKRLKRLDNSSTMEIKEIVSSNGLAAPVEDWWQMS